MGWGQEPSSPLFVSPADSPVAPMLSALDPCFVQPHTDADCSLCADSIGVQLLLEKSLASWLWVRGNKEAIVQARGQSMSTKAKGERIKKIKSRWPSSPKVSYPGVALPSNFSDLLLCTNLLPGVCSEKIWKLGVIMVVCPFPMSTSGKQEGAVG